MTNWKDMYGIGINEFKHSVKSMLFYLDLQRRCIKNMLSKGIEYYTLYYEDMMEDWESCIRKALKFLFDLELSEYNYKKYTVKLHSQDLLFSKLICNSK